MICSFMNRKPAIDGFIKMHDLDTDMEYSFFLNTDQIQKNKKYVDEVSASNKFSEINESAVCFDDADHCQTEKGFKCHY